MQHDLLSQILGAITLPAFMLIIFAKLLDIRPDFLLKPFFDLIGCLLQGLVQLVIALVRALFGAFDRFLQSSADGTRR